MPTCAMTADLLLRWRSNAQQQASASDWPYDLACRVGAQDQTQVVGVLLHRSTQRRLCISRKAVCLVDDHDFETLLGIQIDLLGLCDLLEDVLND